MKDNQTSHSFTRHHTTNSAGRHPASFTIPLAPSDEKTVGDGVNSEPEYLSEASGEDSEGDEYGDARENRGTPEPFLPEDDSFIQPAAISSETRLSSWTDLDLSVVVALVSPIGHWLTGGDHIKNLFLVVLLIFYLHQLIQGKRLSSLHAFFPHYAVHSAMGALSRIASSPATPQVSVPPERCQGSYDPTRPL